MCRFTYCIYEVKNSNTIHKEKKKIIQPTGNNFLQIFIFFLTDGREFFQLAARFASCIRNLAVDTKR